MRGWRGIGAVSIGLIRGYAKNDLLGWVLISSLRDCRGFATACAEGGVDSIGGVSIPAHPEASRRRPVPITAAHHGNAHAESVLLILGFGTDMAQE